MEVDVLDTLQLAGAQNRKRGPPGRDAESDDSLGEDSQEEDYQEEDFLQEEANSLDGHGELETSSNPAIVSTQRSLMSVCGSGESAEADSGSTTSNTPKRPAAALKGKRHFRHKKIILSRKGKQGQRTEMTVTAEGQAILSELKKTNITIIALAERVRKSEKRMQKVEKRVKVSSDSSSKDSSPSSSHNDCCLKKGSIPVGIRVRNSVVHSLHCYILHNVHI